MHPIKLMVGVKCLISVKKRDNFESQKEDRKMIKYSYCLLS